MEEDRMRFHLEGLNRRMTVTVVCAALVGLVAAGHAHAATITIPNNGDPSTAGESLTAALKNAGAGDEIVLSAGQYSIRSTLDLTKNVTISGPTSPPGARIDGGTLTGASSISSGRYDLIAIDTGVSVTIRRVFLTGTGTNGAAVDVFGSLTLTDALVGWNAGLAVAAQPGSSVTVVNSTISDNATGLWTNDGVQVSITSVTLAANRLGGIFNEGDRQVDIANSIVKTMRSKGIGGDKWLGQDHNVVAIVGKEHHRYFIEEGWSKADLQHYLRERIHEPTSGPDDRFCNIGHPEGIRVVAAGGAGMAETWLLMPHLAHAITRVIEPAQL